MKKLILLITFIIPVLCFLSCNKSSDPIAPITPVASTEITIGTQVWSALNLNVDRYRNGDSIPQAQDSNQWLGTQGAWCYYNNDSANKSYGKLYNWPAVNDSRGLAPLGWHIPSDAEWSILTNFLSGDSVAGGKLKAKTLWINPNTGATNESGFTALPGGIRDDRASFIFIGYLAGFWSSTGNGNSFAWGRTLTNSYAGVNRYGNLYKESGLSVRCIKD